jgi:hypothetical protein
LEFIASMNLKWCIGHRLTHPVRNTVPTKLLGTLPFFQCILMALRVLEKVQILPERLGLDFFSFFPE